MNGFAIRNEYQRNLFFSSPYSYPIEGKLDFEKCQALFKSARNKEAGKPIANNTRLFYDKKENVFKIRLHQTDILIIDKDNNYTYNNGEWFTMTTKDRLNTYGPISLWAEKGLWYTGEKIPYFNGMITNKDGKILNGKKQPKGMEQKNRKLTRMISKYIKGFVQEIEKGNFPVPDHGDCWPCLFVDAKKGIQPGHINEFMGFDHYISHMKDNYFVPSLLYRAIQEKGYKDSAFIWHLCMKSPKSHVPLILRWFLNRRRHYLLKYI